MKSRSELEELLIEKLIVEEYRDRTISEYKNTLNRIYNHFIINKKEINNKNLNDYLVNIKNKTELSRAVNVIRILKEFEETFNCFSSSELKEIISEKSNNRHRPYDPYSLSEVKRKINTIRDKKYKLGFRLMIVSGLRVFELSELKKQDIIFNSDKTITLKVLNGKGGKAAEIKCLKDDYLYKELQEFLEDKLEEEKVFYSKIAMQKKALRLRFKCHDLRRAYSKLVEKEIQENTKDFPEDEQKEILEEELKEAMRHSKIDTSYSYINSKRIEVD